MGISGNTGERHYFAFRYSVVLADAEERAAETSDRGIPIDNGCDFDVKANYDCDCGRRYGDGIAGHFDEIQ